MVAMVKKATKVRREKLVSPSTQEMGIHPLVLETMATPTSTTRQVKSTPRMAVRGLQSET